MSIWFIKTKQLLARIVDRNSFSQQANRTFSKKEVLQTNLSDANPAAICARAEAAVEASVRCLTLFAPHAAGIARFRSNPEPTVPFIAAIVFPTKDSLRHQAFFEPLSKTVMLATSRQSG